MPRKQQWQQPAFDFSAAPAQKPETEKSPVVPPPVKPTGLIKPNGHVARLKAQRGSLNLFDFDYSGEPEPAEQLPAAEPPAPPVAAAPPATRTLPDIASGEKAKALDAIAAIKTLKQIEAEDRPATPDERKRLARFPGFGPVALSIFKNPVTGKYKDGWREIAIELENILTPEEMASAKKSTFNAFYTSPIVITAMHKALAQLGVPENATVVEPGMGTGNFAAYAPSGYKFIGVELEDITGRIARLLHPGHDIRIEPFQDSRIPLVDAAIGNPPFADVKIDYAGQKFALHDFCIAKSLDALKSGGILAMVTSHFTLDRQNAEAREGFASKADFLGAIRLPSDAFRREGTAVVTDIVFFRKRAPGEHARHEEAEWQRSRPMEIDGVEVSVNRYFQRHPEMVLGDWSRKDTLYGDAGYSIKANGELAEQLREAIGRLPTFNRRQTAPEFHKPGSDPGSLPPAAATVPSGLSEGSFFVADDSRIYQLNDGQPSPVIYGGSQLWANGALLGRRMGALIRLRDLARNVLRSQNEGWPEADRQEARRDLNYAYDRFDSQFGPINKTTLSETKDGSTIRRMNNIVKFREDPDAMLVLALEEYDDETGKATKAAIMRKDVVGKIPPITSVRSAEEGLLVSLDQKGGVDLTFIRSLYGKHEEEIIAELGDLIYRDPETQEFQTADEYLSGNVRHKLAVAEKAGHAYARNADKLRTVIPEDVLPGDIDAGLASPWIPESDIQQFATELFKVSPSDITIGHLKRDAVWSVDANYAAVQSVAATSEFGTPRMNGTHIFELALNMKSPAIYDTVKDGDRETRVLNPEATQAAKEKQKQIKQRFKDWVFADPERAERLCRLYNDNFNCIRLRQFDGSHLEFPGMAGTFLLRQHQKDAVWRGMSSGNTLLAHCVGAGKAQPLDAKVLTPTGFVRMGDLRIKDEVIAKDGTVTTVTGVFPQGLKAIWRVAFSDGSSTECCDEHLWLTQTYRERNSAQNGKRLGKTWNCAAPKIRTTAEIRNTLISSHLNAKNHSIPMVNVVHMYEQPVPIDPYLIGLLLGDGSLTKTHVSLCNPDEEIFKYVTLPDNIEISDITGQSRCKTWGFRMIHVTGFGAERTRNPLTMALENLGLIGTMSDTKFIPECYKINSQSVRLAILRGLLDTDGYVQKNGASTYYYTTSNQLADDVVFLVQSLGGLVRRRIKERPTYRYKGELRIGKPCHNLCISLPPDINPFRLTRKADQVRPKSSYVPRRYIVSVEPVGIKAAQCISVAHPSQLYVTDDFIVTHNTAVMAATGMKMKQAGLIKKPIFVVPNHILEQFAREFQQIYPNAKLLVATKEDLAKDRRKLLTAKIASGEWDGILITHSSFERIGMSRKYQQAFLEEQIKEYNDLLIETAATKAGKNNRNLMKTIEKQKAQRQEKLKDLLAEDKKDDGLTFDLLGIDQIFADESNAYKNLETPTKMERVAGIQTGGSERAFDMYMKTCFLHERHPGHGITFASGTPISNSLVEMYTLQRFLDPDGLRTRGIEHFDAWAATFGEVVESMEISPDGKSLRPRSRFARFVNLPELCQMWRSFADVQTAEMLDLPRPQLEGGKAHVVARPMSEEQYNLQQELVERYERLRSSKVDPREDNALKITTEGRKLALDARLLSPNAPPSPDSKIDAMADQVAETWERTTDKRGTQIIFCDLGVNPTAWNYSVYQEILEKLIDKNIPREQIAVIGDADSDQKKFVLFEKVRQGKIRILIGSTSKLGTGTNVQKRLAALHHVDPTWKPAEIEQREGRILRQGNDNAEVAIYRYVTEGSFDAFMWQTLETKARFIGQVMRGESGVRRADDIGGQELSYAEVKAIASGNPCFLVLAEADAELQRLNLLKKNHADEQFLARRNIRDLPEEISRLKTRLDSLAADGATVKQNEKAPIVIASQSCSHEEAMSALVNQLNRIPENSHERRYVPIGSYHGLAFGIALSSYGAPDVYLQGKVTRHDTLSREHQGPRAVLNALARIAGAYDAECKRTAEFLAIAEAKLRDYQAAVGKPFTHERYLDELTDLRDQLKTSLGGFQQEGQPTSGDIAERIRALKAGNTVESAPARTVRKQAVETPVTTRILARANDNEPTVMVEVEAISKAATDRQI